MNRALAVLAIAGAIIIALLAVPPFGRDDRARARRQPATPSAATVDPREATSATPDQDGDQGSLDGESDAPGGPSVHGSVSSSRGGSPGESAWVLATLADGTTRSVEARGGRYSLSDLPPGTCGLSVRARGHREAHATVEIKPGATRRNFLLTAAMAIRVFVKTTKGQPLQMPNGVPGLVAVATSRPLERLPLPQARHSAYYGLGAFHTRRPNLNETLPAGLVGILMVNASAPFHVSATLGNAVLATQLVSGPTEEITFIVNREDVERLLSTVTLRVRDPRGGLVRFARATMRGSVIRSGKSSQMIVSARDQVMSRTES